MREMVQGDRIEEPVRTGTCEDWSLTMEGFPSTAVPTVRGAGSC